MKRYKVDDIYCPHECSFGCTGCKLVLGVYRNNEFDFVLIKEPDGWEYEIGMENQIGKRLAQYELCPLGFFDLQMRVKWIAVGEELMFNELGCIIESINKELIE